MVPRRGRGTVKQSKLSVAATSREVSNRVKGWLFRLDGRELLVLSLGRTGSASSQLFRVSSTSWNEIEDAVVFGT